MTREPSIKQLLAAKGIECRPSKHFACKELWRGTEFLGDFNAGGAVQKFLETPTSAADEMVTCEDCNGAGGDGCGATCGKCGGAGGYLVQVPA